MSDRISVGIGLIVLIVLAYSLYRPRVQQSSRYQAIVVPLANIMDVGFIVFAPAFILLAGYAAPLVMLGICLVAIAAGFVLAYNIRNAEPLAGTGDRVSIVDEVARWALLAASIVNIAYYTLLLMTLALWPLGIHSQFRVTVLGTGLLVLIALVGWFGGLDRINRVGSLTTAFNLSAITAVLVAFFVFNVVQALDGKWELPDREWSITGTEFRQLIGLFAIVQGFEAARYIGGRFGAEERISAMRSAQIIATIVFVTLLATALILFIAVTDFDGVTIFAVSDEVGPLLPWLIFLAAIGSQTSAIVNATMSRSDMMVEAKIPRRLTFLVILIPALAIFILVDVAQAVTLASRIFAAYFATQALIAVILARRNQNWAAVAGFTAVGAAMLTVMIFGLPV